uniref:Uncharacterized protein n=1 Tax=Panagrolaimus davidi TaxID=227884 RepID=A0A914QKU4_9BILA
MEQISVNSTPIGFTPVTATREELLRIKPGDTTVLTLQMIKAYPLEKRTTRFSAEPKNYQKFDLIGQDKDLIVTAEAWDNNCELISNLLPEKAFVKIKFTAKQLYNTTLVETPIQFSIGFSHKMAQLAIPDDPNDSNNRPSTE